MKKFNPRSFSKYCLIPVRYIHNQLLIICGFDAIQFFHSLLALPFFIWGLIYSFFSGILIHSISFNLSDRFDSKLVPDHEYFSLDYLASSFVLRSKTSCLLDIGSRIDGFVNMVSLYCNVTVADIRIPSDCPSWIKFKKINLFDIDIKTFESFSYISCLHTLEHVGTGRYGDSIYPDGPLTALKHLLHSMRHGCTLLFSLPLSLTTRVCYNSFTSVSIADFYSVVSPISFSRVSIFAYTNKYVFTATTLPELINFVTAEPRLVLFEFTL